MKTDKESVTKWLARLCIVNYVLLLLYFFLGLYIDVLLIMSLLVFGSPLTVLYAVRCWPAKTGKDQKMSSGQAQEILALLRAEKQKRESRNVEKPAVDHAYHELLEVFNGGDTLE